MSEENKHPAAKAFKEWRLGAEGVQMVHNPIPDFPFGREANMKLRLQRAFNAGFVAGERNRKLEVINAKK